MLHIQDDPSDDEAAAELADRFRNDDGHQTQSAEGKKNAQGNTSDLRNTGVASGSHPTKFKWGDMQWAGGKGKSNM